MRKAIFAFLLSLSWVPLKAQEEDTLASARILAVKELPVVKAVEQVQPDALPAPPLQLAEVIRAFTGLQVKDYGGVGGLKTVNVRSLGSEHVGIFLDGIQIDNAQNMQVDLGRFSPDALQGIALYSAVKGVRLSAAKEYAAGAAVHLYSARKPDGLELRLRGGSFATVNPSAQWRKTWGKLSLRAAADFLYSSGRYKYPYFDTTLVRENGDIRALRLETQLYGQLRRGEWQLHLWGYGSERGFPGPVIRRASGFPLSAERQEDRDLFLQGSWRQEWTARYATALRFKCAHNYIHYDSHPEKNPMAVPHNLHYLQNSIYLSLAQSFVILGPWRADLAVDLQSNALESEVTRSVRPRRTTLTTALATQAVWERFRVAAHLVHLGAWDKSAFRSAWMPSLSLYYSPWSWLELDAFCKRSYRLPSFNDLYYSFIGNSRLSPEDALQLGADARLFAQKGPWKAEARISPYFNRVSNKIVAIPTSSQFRWTMLNLGLAHITGVDAKAALGYENAPWSLSLTLRYTLQRALDHSSPGGLTWGNQIPYIPLHSGGADLLVCHGRWSLLWNTLWSGQKWSRSANIDDYRLAPWSTTDLSLGWDALPSLRLSLRLNNLFNARYQLVPGYPMPGTAVMFSAEWRITPKQTLGEG